MCVLLGIFLEFPIDLCYEPLTWFMIVSDHSTIIYIVSQEKINISACVNGIPYINGSREMGVHERIASVT